MKNTQVVWILECRKIDTTLLLLNGCSKVYIFLASSHRTGKANFSHSDTLITSFPQTWGQSGSESKNHDLLANILPHIRHPRDEPFTSVEDVVIMIVQRCSTIFTSDPKLLFPLPLLLEVYQEVIGDVASLIHTRYPRPTNQI